MVETPPLLRRILRYRNTSRNACLHVLGDVPMSAADVCVALGRKKSYDIKYLLDELVVAGSAVTSYRPTVRRDGMHGRPTKCYSRA